MCQRLWAAVSRREWLCTVLSMVSHAGVLAACVVLAVFAWLAFVQTPLGALAALAVLAVGFAAVSVWRQLRSSPRPYERYPELFVTRPKDTCARSFPSRHAFCAFAIGTTACAVLLPLGVLMLALAIAQAGARVLRGIHFIKDVAVGAALGVLTGLLATVGYILLG